MTGHVHVVGAGVPGSGTPSQAGRCRGRGMRGRTAPVQGTDSGRRESGDRRPARVGPGGWWSGIWTTDKKPAPSGGLSKGRLGILTVQISVHYVNQCLPRGHRCQTVIRSTGDELFRRCEAIQKGKHTRRLMTFVYWKGWPAQASSQTRCVQRAKAGLRGRVSSRPRGYPIEDGIVEVWRNKVSMCTGTGKALRN